MRSYCECGSSTILSKLGQGVAVVVSATGKGKRTPPPPGFPLRGVQADCPGCVSILRSHIYQAPCYRKASTITSTTTHTPSDEFPSLEQRVESASAERCDDGMGYVSRRLTFLSRQPFALCVPPPVCRISAPKFIAESGSSVNISDRMLYGITFH